MARCGRYGAFLVFLLALGGVARWGVGSRGWDEGGPAAVEVGLDGQEGEVKPTPREPPTPTPSPTALPPEQALVAAVAARRAGDRVGEEAMLAAALDGGDLVQVAGVRLAEMVVDEEPRRAATALLPVLLSSRSRDLQRSAVDLAARAVTADAGAVDEADLRRVVAVLPRPAARRLELAAARHDPELRRQRLDRLLRESVDDLVALAAAEELVALAAAEGEAGLGQLGARERWLTGQAFFQHGLYTETLRLLSGLGEGAADGFSPWELAFVSGRASFRLGRWEEATARYREAVAAADTDERRAVLEVHRSRALELGGSLEEAVEAARRAVVLRATDERRLHLLRLRLRQGRLDLAAEGQRRLRSRSARWEGALRLALHDVAAGRLDSARRQLEPIRSGTWGAAAAVIRAQLAAAEGEWGAAAAMLDGSAELLDPYWGVAARRVMASLPVAALEEWRERCRKALGEGVGGSRRRAVQRWAVLESDREALAELRREVAGSTSLEPPDPGSPAFTTPLAARLWSLGLGAEVARFDPGAFPGSTPGEAMWSARTLLSFGRVRQAIRLVEAVADRAYPRLPARVLPAEAREVLFPLPWPELVVEAAADSGVDWPLLAGLVREESRWESTALSPVGARGLTQLMPATAAAAASRRGWAVPEPDALFEPRVALRLGATELARLMAAFAGHRAAAVAGYNAGESQARLWLEQCGPGCTEERLVASITFDATRGYVAEVLATEEEYRELYPGLATPAGAVARPSDPHPRYRRRSGVRHRR